MLLRRDHGLSGQFLDLLSSGLLALDWLSRGTARRLGTLLLQGTSRGDLNTKYEWGKKRTPSLSLPKSYVENASRYYLRCLTFFLCHCLNQILKWTFESAKFILPSLFEILFDNIYFFFMDDKCFCWRSQIFSSNDYDEEKINAIVIMISYCIKENCRLLWKLLSSVVVAEQQEMLTTGKRRTLFVINQRPKSVSGLFDILLA